MWLLFLLLYLVAGWALTQLSGNLIARQLEKFPAMPNGGLPQGGRLIGYLERLLVFIFIQLGSYEVIGFLATAKSILRFGESRRDKECAEYVLLGTLLSFCAAVLIGVGVRGIVSYLLSSSGGE